MMQDRGTFLRVGLLVLFGIAALVALVVFFSGSRIREGQDFESYFSESVQGLEVGAPVKFRGVTLGQVTEISLVRAAYSGAVAHPAGTSALALVIVRFRMDMSKIGERVSIEQTIRDGLRARLASQGITGVSYIELDFLPPEAHPPLAIPWRPLDTYIPSVPSTLIQVQDAAQQLLQKLNAVDLVGLVNGLNGLVEDLRGDVAHGDVHALLAQATQGVQDLDSAVRAANLPAVAAQAQQALKAASNVADGKQTRELIGNANQAVAKLAAAVAQLPPLIAALQATVQRADNGTADLEQSLTPVLRDLQVTLGNLRDTSAQLRRDPGQVLFGGPPPRAPGAGQ
jgi:ABC-type transporter Mla subunit MlaD